jgi:hypothetical protein
MRRRVAGSGLRARSVHPSINLPVRPLDCQSVCPPVSSLCVSKPLCACICVCTYGKQVELEGVGRHLVDHPRVACRWESVRNRSCFGSL